MNSNPDNENTQPESSPSLTLDQQFARLFDMEEIPYTSRVTPRKIQRPPRVQTAAKSILGLTLGVVAALLFLAIVIALFALTPR